MKRFDIVTANDLATKGKFIAGRPTHTLVIHCSASAYGANYTAKDVYKLHTSPPRNWKDIGYHFYIELDGTIRVGRQLSEIGAHVAGKNTGTIGVAYCGGLAKDRSPLDTRNTAQRLSLIELTKAITRDNRDITRISGHNQYSPKACPSFNVEEDKLGNITGFRNGRRIGDGGGSQTKPPVHEESTGLQHFVSMVIQFLRSLFGAK